MINLTKIKSTPSLPPKSWMVESILVTLFCCLPFGIAGIVNASKVESKFYAGDIAGAKRASDEAGKWTKVSFFIGIGVVVLYAILMAVGVAASAI
ncbi:MAG: CD225/dispanin family protein [Bacteroidia bacterium]